ncbi:hypothetical protein BU16DRAFT_554123 [Lophium mytilinum]|uniref:Uncharacterized protein n=1 Tax=Lophium mytilinum TaxID=390894 RepID=A0A6A6RB78_9PEZI|nr:hypothetical protein BU16DRAFT_554123 [Lophium mytilinum]
MGRGRGYDMSLPPEFQAAQASSTNPPGQIPAPARATKVVKGAQPEPNAGQNSAGSSKSQLRGTQQPSAHERQNPSLRTLSTEMATPRAINNPLHHDFEGSFRPFPFSPFAHTPSAAYTAAASDMGSDSLANHHSHLQNDDSVPYGAGADMQDAPVSAMPYGPPGYAGSRMSITGELQQLPQDNISGAAYQTWAFENGIPISPFPGTLGQVESPSELHDIDQAAGRAYRVGLRNAVMPPEDGLTDENGIPATWESFCSPLQDGLLAPAGTVHASTGVYGGLGLGYQPEGRVVVGERQNFQLGQHEEVTGQSTSSDYPDPHSNQQQPRQPGNGPVFNQHAFSTPLAPAGSTAALRTLAPRMGHVKSTASSSPSGLLKNRPRAVSTRRKPGVHPELLDQRPCLAEGCSGTAPPGLGYGRYCSYACQQLGGTPRRSRAKGAVSTIDTVSGQPRRT